MKVLIKMRSSLKKNFYKTTVKRGSEGSMRQENEMLVIKAPAFCHVPSCTCFPVKQKCKFRELLDVSILIFLFLFYIFYIILLINKINGLKGGND